MARRRMTGSNMRLLQPAEEHPDRQSATVLVDLFGCFQTDDSLSYRLSGAYLPLPQPNESWLNFIA